MTNSQNSKNQSYLELSEELEKIINDLHSSGQDIDKVLKDYQRGIVLTSKIEEYLLSSKNKIVKNSKITSKK